MHEFRAEEGRDAPGLMQFLEDRIYEYNSAMLDRHDGRLFSRVVRDGERIIAGVAGWTWADACEITQLWVDEGMRNHGIGKTLLQAAEEEARACKCRVVLVKTYSFQAPAFYEKCGYRVVQVIEGFPPGHRYHTLTKSLL